MYAFQYCIISDPDKHICLETGAIIFVTGYFGESVPSNSGLVSIIKAHGYYGQTGPASTYLHLTTEEILKTNGNAVVLIRNPFRAICGYRHTLKAGHTGHTNASQFIAPGLFHLFDNQSLDYKSIDNSNILKDLISYRLG